MDNNVCKVSIGEYVNSRRCFITGEYCSKQTDIYKARKKLYEKNRPSVGNNQQTPRIPSPEINAFVVMNFSNMSNVAYEQRIKPFIEGLTGYFYFVDNQKSIACIADPNSPPPGGVPVSKINVIRADSNFASNFVICNRVCQQMQIADLIVVDVSVRNANVFYELGLAIAMGKLILPVCFSDSYFHKDPEIEKLNLTKTKKGKKQHHIARYTWRRHLFEYYGLRHKDTTNEFDAWYLEFNKESKGNLDSFSSLGYCASCPKQTTRVDSEIVKYFQFPYNNVFKEHNSGDEKPIGLTIYNRLRTSFNTAEPDHNTLLLYTLESFLHCDQVGRCIINYYNYFTYQVKEMQCFCGDRVGTLAQLNVIPEHDKDDVQKKTRQLPYNVSEIIHIGVNQATYATYQDTVKPIDFLNSTGNDVTLKKIKDKSKSRYIRYLKEYTGNRSMLIYPENPVYVERLEQHVQPDLLSNTNLEKFFCLYHIMLRNLRYVREIVVDISDTSLESLFWLGMAHGADVYAITVQRQETDMEQAQVSSIAKRKARSIIDVAGLWCAQFRSDDTQGFYHQLQSVNQNIEQHSKLMLPNMYQNELAMYEQLRALPWEQDIPKSPDEIISTLISELKNEMEATAYNMLNHDISSVIQQLTHTIEAISSTTRISTFRTAQEQQTKITASEIMTNLRKESQFALESYYRTCFWRTMLKDNHVQVYIREKDETIIDESYQDHDLEPRSNISRWDFEATVALSRYLARRTPVGEYEINTYKDKNPNPSSTSHNVINIGAYSKPFLSQGKNVDLPSFIFNKGGSSASEVRHFTEHSTKCDSCNGQVKNATCFHCRGFATRENKQLKECWYTQLAHAKCPTESYATESSHGKANQSVYHYCGPVFVNKLPIPDKCSVFGENTHLQLGQLLLWREGEKQNRHFYVSLTGASGPATKALSSLLVSDILKCSIFNANNDNSKNQFWLSELQTEIRKQFIDEFTRTVGSDDSRKPVRHAAKLYLTTVLYRHFLPFLTQEDENRIINGAEYFLRSLRISGEIDDLERKALGGGKNYSDKNINDIILILKNLLQAFRGIDALYQVTVKTNHLGDIDSRSIVCMEPMKDEEDKISNHADWLKCLYLPYQQDDKTVS